jgi:hypothetical protein
MKDQNVQSKDAGVNMGLLAVAVGKLPSPMLAARDAAGEFAKNQNAVVAASAAGHKIIDEYAAELVKLVPEYNKIGIAAAGSSLSPS